MKLQNEIELRKTNEDELRKLISAREADIKAQRKMFDEAGNPEYDNMMNIENKMKNSLEKLMDDRLGTIHEKIELSINTLITKKFNESSANLQNIERKIQGAIEHNETFIDLTGKTDAAATNTWSSVVSGQRNQFKKAIREIKNDDKIEELEIEKRSKNIIIHGAKEIGENTNDVKKEDQGYVKNILEILGIPTPPESVLRLGKPNEGKKRPLKVTMTSKEEKANVMSSLGKLKGTEDVLGRISVTDDYTATEREEVKQWVMKAKEKNEQDSDKVYKVRGDPKNGMRLIWFPKNH